MYGYCLSITADINKRESNTFFAAGLLNTYVQFWNPSNTEPSVHQELSLGVCTPEKVREATEIHLHRDRKRYGKSHIFFN